MKNAFVKIIILIALLHQSNIYGQNITTIAGTGVWSYNGDCIPATTAKLNNDPRIAVDSHGNIYMGDAANNRVRKVDVATGIITTVAGTGIAGFSGDSGLATVAQLNGPTCLAFDPAGNLYIGDGSNDRIRKVDAITNIITTYVGNGIVGYSGDSVMADTSAINAGDFAFDNLGNMYMCNAYRISKIDITGLMTTIAGTGVSGVTLDSVPALSTNIDTWPAISTDIHGNVFFVDGHGSIQEIVMSTGYLYRVAGTGTGIGPYTGDSTLATACTMNPSSVFVDSFGNIYAATNTDQICIKIDTFGYTHTVAGTGIGGFSGDGGPATSAKLYYPRDVIFDLYGNMYISDWDNGRIRKVTYNSVSLTFNFSIAASPGDTVCTGTSVTYSATASAPGIGGSYSYQWYVNGSPVIDTANTYTYMPSNGDSIFCICTSNPCSILDTSNVIHMVVTSATTPTITISASPGDTVCSGTPVTYTSTVTGGGTSLTYYWYVNGSVVSSAGSSYSYTPANRDSVRCVCTGLSSCTSTLTASSNTINMVVQPYTTPTITVNAPVSAMLGSIVTVTATVAGAGSSYSMMWYDNGAWFATTTVPTTTYTKTYNVDTITATVASTSAGCWDSSTSNMWLVGDTSLGTSPYPLQRGNFTIYPNPASGVITITSAEDITSVEVRNVYGQRIPSPLPSPQVERVTGSQAGRKVTLDISMLPAGVYILCITQQPTPNPSQEGNTVVRKIVKE